MKICVGALTVACRLLRAFDYSLFSKTFVELACAQPDFMAEARQTVIAHINPFHFRLTGPSLRVLGIQQLVF
ncbi:hypothetical protein EDB19DRAFT_1735327 [Suillus lakei]|nr:hypothetical protein EDB19DRAFT_1735327 [Suillus lakei]